MTSPVWITPTEVATILGISRSAVYARVASGSIPAEAVMPRPTPNSALLLRRSFFVDDQPANITPIDRPGLSDAQMERLADLVSDLIVRKLALKQLTGSVSA